MHLALYINEIISLICDNLKAPDVDTVSLGRLARTCRVFTEPALDALWEMQESLGPLTQVMPPDLWISELGVHRGKLGHRGKVITFRRDLVDTDWKPRLEYYGRKIRLLHQSCFVACVVHHDVFTAISAYRPIRILLPNLRSVFLNLGHPYFSKAIPFFQCILGTNVREISIRYHGMAKASSLPRLLSTIPRLCPNVQSFRIGSSTKLPPSSNSNLYHCLICLDNLREVEIDMTDSIPTGEVINHLAHLSSLEAWSGAIIPWTPESLFFTTDGQRFENLHEFLFTATTWEAAAKLVKDMRCAFTLLDVSINNPDSSEVELSTFEQLLDAFTERHPASTSLSSLRITGDVAIHQYSSEAQKSFLHKMRNLFSLQSLRNLEIDVQAVSLLDDSWISGAATAWPGLQQLSLDGRGTPHATLAGWVPLLKNCAELELLHITSIFRPFSTKLLSGVCNAHITHIGSQASVLESPTAVFRCLTAMFPRLRSVYNDSNREDEQGEDWDQLKKMLDESGECSTW
ncbi:hypothetical protein Hypma_011192 [Hypsizygus marmoreus]|uniref:F-box domain-containing protein n=1 Tax=Hypsizygus marmoreus TaxID=39966 RepID=A0A369JQG7_HYPMA|nr:hypothetical protein Hypma_011192 [Hypsizygus marmoreus]